MAKNLNRKRILHSKLALAITFLVVLLSRQYWEEENEYHELFEMVGIILVSICVMGRIYATAFLGGFKNESLITHGSYSLMRNPLYFFTLVGIIGVSLLSNHVSIMIGLPLFFSVLYISLIKREEVFLTETFGEDFLRYKQAVPALLPKFSNYNAPNVIEMYPKFLAKSFLDAIWWLSALPLIELAEYLQEENILPILFVS